MLWADYFTVVNTDSKTKYGSLNEDIVHDLIPHDKLRYSDNVDQDNYGAFSFAQARNLCLEMTDEDDFVLIVDADDVHYPEWEAIVRDKIKVYDSITAYFYHLMVYKNIYQYTQPREIVYRNYAGTRWQKGVHELLVNKKNTATTAHYFYMHYGYIKSQKEVFKRWKFYSDLEGDFTHYDGQNPNTILDDRVAVCKPLPVQHPEIIKPFLQSYPDCPTKVLRKSPEPTGTYGEGKVGLILLTSNDEELIDRCLGTLAETTGPPDFTVLAIDCNSTDKSLELLQDWQRQGSIDMEIVGAETYTSLTEALNFGFDYFRTHEAYDYVGWIHPDMEFVQQEWLHFLWLELLEDAKIGKVCAANWRDTVPDEIIDGHEQCYILRKDILHKVGLFDENYVGIGGYEDWDLNKRITLHSGPEGFYRVVITPRSWVLHHGMQTRSRRDTRTEQVKNSQYYYNKWGTYEAPV